MIPPLSSDAAESAFQRRVSLEWGSVPLSSPANLRVDLMAEAILGHDVEAAFLRKKQ